MKAKVAILRVEPGRILEDVARLCELAGLRQTLAPGSTTILKDNISWHFPFPAASPEVLRMAAGISTTRFW